MFLLKEKSAPSIVVSSYLAVAGFFIYNVYIAIISFLQFSTYDIFLIAVLFLFVFVIVDMLFSAEFYFKIRMPFLKEVILAFFILIVIIIYAEPSKSIHPSYIKTFPMLELSNGLGFHQDTAYHVSLIQSIINHGYPSTAQHGVPFNVYHVLSHYVDAAILKISGLNPFDSYGLLYRFKIFVFISAALLLVSRSFKENSIFPYFLGVVLFIPLVLGSWHGTLSHGLWMASLILLLSYNFLYVELNKLNISYRSIFVIWLIVIAISLAKISTGFMMSVFIGLFLFFRFPKKIGVYIFGITLILFFYFYSKLFSVETSSGMVFSNISFETMNGFLYKKNVWTPLLEFLYLAIIFWLIMFFFLKRNKYIFLSVSCVGSIFVLYFVTAVQAGLNSSEKWYFVYGLSSVVCLFVFRSVVDFVGEYCSLVKVNRFSSGYVISVFLFLMVLSVLNSYPVRSFAILNTHPKVLFRVLLSSFDGNFSYVEINKKLSSEEELSSKLSVSELRARYEALAKNGSMFKLNSIVESALVDNSISKHDIYMYLSKDVFHDQIAPLGGAEWANGLMVYAITGIPLVNGVKEKNRTYGLSGYNEDSHRVNINDFYLESEFCLKNKIKYILMINNLKNQDYDLVSCVGT